MPSAQLIWLVDPKLIERDEAETKTLEAARQLFEAAVPLRFRRRNTLSGQRGKIAKMLLARWKRQQKAVIRDAEPHLRMMLTEAETPAETRKRRANELAAAAIIASMLSGPTSADIEAWDSAIGGAVAAGAEYAAGELGTEVSTESFEAAYLRTRGFAKVAADLDETTLTRLRNAVADAYSDGSDYEGIVQAVRGVFTDFAETRLDTIAWTELNGAFSQGQIEAGRQAGAATKTWQTDGNPCEDCVANEEQGAIGIDEDFESGDDAPPAHPNAVLAGSTFASYGRLIRMVAAKYNGLAISLDAGQYHTTIGPNHPMLTPRGKVPAKLLRVGDQLLYDCRAINGSLARETDLNKIAFIENGFAALKMASGLARIPASSDDFHGDAIMRDEEVEVVLAKRQLLPELDPGILERCGKAPLVLSDVETEGESSPGTFAHNFNGIFLTASGSVGGGDVEHYRILTVKDIRKVYVDTMAFDASTATGLYCSDGFVVSNCECEVEIQGAEE